ncbi:hypothetical protein CDD81_1343 [Ophiocordyceps australis]|uniref:SMP-30/Gluconolactonase/LRE-like region domain-containing protein n=1 Tax=Ophiocordyceps australis TaxID=1399860 RepID=A0A2C5Y1D2_9HYPO|nr:hypothetical protein CDD81_1343 [Ophiocordyceps australis]
MAHVAVAQWNVTQPWLEPHCALGEGPFYESQTHSIRFVDIKKCQLLTASLHGGPESLHVLQVDATSPSVTADIQGVDPREQIVVGVKQGLAVLDRRSGHCRLLSRFAAGEQDNARLRSNDGAVDCNGRFWLGSMTDFDFGEVQAEGSLFRFSATAAADVAVANIAIPNSVGWSPDGTVMYFADSRAHQIRSWDYDASASWAASALQKPRVLYQHDGPGEPDGFRVDVDGNIWTAVYGEGRVLKIDSGGRVTGVVTLPTRNITCVEFASTELIITSAADDDGANALSRRYGGAVFRVDVGTTGLDLFKFRM